MDIGFGVSAAAMAMGLLSLICGTLVYADLRKPLKELCERLGSFLKHMLGYLAYNTGHDTKAVIMGTKRKTEVLETCLQQMKAWILGFTSFLTFNGLGTQGLN